MKPVRNIFLMMILVSGLSFSQNIMVVHDTSGAANDTVTVRLSVRNDSVFVAFQTDIELPAGFVFIPNSAKLSTRKADHTVSASVVNGNKLRVIAFSFTQSQFTGSAGDVMTFRVKLTGIPGNYQLPLQNTILSGRYSNNVLTGVINGNLTVYGPEINLDPLNLNFGRLPLNSPGYQTFSVQNTGNSVLTISRIFCVTDNFKVLGDTNFVLQPYESRQVTVQFPSIKKGVFSDKIFVVSNDPDEPVLFVRVGATAFAVNELHLLNASGRSGYPVTIDLRINNMEPFTGFQFDLNLPEVLTFIPGSAVLSERGNAHSVFANLLPGNRLRVVAFSTSNSQFTGNDGNVVSLGFSLEGSSGDYPLIPDSVIITDTSGSNIVSGIYPGFVRIISPDISGNSVMEMGEVVNNDTLIAKYSFSNSGSDTLIVSAITSPDPAFTNLTPLPVFIPQGESSSVTIMFYNKERGAYQSRFLVRSNDPDEDPFYFTAKAVSYIPNFIIMSDTIVFADDTAKVALQIKNAEEVVAFQVDLRLPDSVTFVTDGFEKTGRLNDHTVNIRNIGDNTIRIFAFSLNQSAIPGSDGPVGYFKFRVGNISGNRVLQLVDGILSDKESRNVIKGTINGNLMVYPRPQPPQLVAPGNKSADVFIPVQFSWQNSVNANTHQFQVSTDSLMQNILKDTITESGVSVGLPLLQHSTKYFWRVRGKNDGGFGDWSGVFSFVTVVEKPSVPVLALPANGSKGILNPVTAKWSKSLRVEKYKLQVSTDVNFTSLVVNDSTVTDTVKILPTLSNYMQYYWRLKAVNVGGESDWSTVWSFKTLGNPYGGSLYEPLNNSVNLPLDGVSFKWSKSKERIETITKHHLQISTDSLFGSLYINDSTLTDTSRIVNGMSYLTKYFWRVRAQNETGWGDWSNVWQFTTIIDKPGIPALASPANNSRGLIIPVTMIWYRSARAEKYILHGSTDSTFNTININRTVLDTFRVQTLLTYDTKIFWRVKAVNVGGESDWSTVWNFKTLGNPYASSLYDPLNNSVNHPLNGVSFKWSKSKERIETITKYQFQISTDSLFGSLFISDTTLTDTSRIVNGMSYLTKYYWRVRAQNETGWGDWSNTWKFTTIIEKPTSPVLATPVNNSMGLLNPVTTNWNKSLRVERYKLQVASDDLFTNLTFVDSVLTDTLRILPNLANYTQYYWRVKAVNVGGESDWSTVWNFKTLGNPYASNLIQPADQSVNQPINGLTFKWTKAHERIESIQKYQFQVSTDSLFSTTLVNDSTLTDTVKVVGGMANLTKYFWRVRAQNQTGWGDWSNTWKFTTIIEKPTVPVLALPANGSKGLLNPITTNWNKSLRAEKYKLQLSTDSLFGSLFVNDSTLTDTTKLLPNLGNFTQYYWRVKAVNVGGESDWSTFYNFKTLGNPYASNLIEPLNGSVNQPLSGLTFKWTKAQERIETIQKYQFQISTDSLFGSLIINDSTLTDTSRVVNGMNYLTKYFWRVRAQNQTGWGDWSAVWNTTTIIEKPTVPLLATPVNGAIGLINPVTVNWNRSQRAERYRLQVSTDSLFSGLIVNDSTVTDSTRVLPELPNYTKFFWRVKAFNVGGDSEWSDVWNFKTLGTPCSVVLSYPANGAVNVPVNSITFKWYKPRERTETIIKYHFQLAYDSLFGSIAFYDSTYMLDTATTGSGFPVQTTFFWRVRAKNQTGWGDWSEGWHFRTIIDKPIVPGLSSPPNNSTQQLQPVVLKWRPSFRATGYTLQLSEDPAFGTLLLADSTLTDTSRILPPLDAPKTYYWRVSARNVGGVSDWSTVWNFRTLGLPSTPVLVSPGNGAVNLPVDDLAFTWSNGGEQTFGAVTLEGKPAKEGTSRSRTNLPGRKAQATQSIPLPSGNPVLVTTLTIGKYWLEIRTDTTGTSFFADSTITDTTKLVSGFGYFTTYFWRVKAQNEVGWGNFTAWNHFKTVKRLIAAPSGLVATAIEVGKVKLEWSDNSDIESGFVIARKTGDSTSLDPLVIIDTVGADVTQYIDSLVSDTTLYSYIVAGYNSDTASLPSNYAQVFTLTGIKEMFTDQLPGKFDLYQNYPNPFNPSTVIRFAIPKESNVRIELFSIQGELIKVLRSENMSAGYYETRLEIPNYASGIYLYRIVAQPVNESEKFINTKKLILVK